MDSWAFMCTSNKYYSINEILQRTFRMFNAMFIGAHFSNLIHSSKQLKNVKQRTYNKKVGQLILFFTKGNEKGGNENYLLDALQV